MHSILSLFTRDPFFEYIFDTASERAPITHYTDGTDKVIEIDVPGSSSEDVEVSTHEGILRLTWSRKGRDQKESRSFTLPKTIDEGAISATVKDGVLTVRLPARAETQARKILVS